MRKSKLAGVPHAEILDKLSIPGNTCKSVAEEYGLSPSGITEFFKGSKHELKYLELMNDNRLAFAKKNGERMGKERVMQLRNSWNDTIEEQFQMWESGNTLAEIAGRSNRGHGSLAKRLKYSNKIRYEICLALSRKRTGKINGRGNREKNRQICDRDNPALSDKVFFSIPKNQVRVYLLFFVVDQSLFLKIGKGSLSRLLGSRKLIESAEIEITGFDFSAIRYLGKMCWVTEQVDRAERTLLHYWLGRYEPIILTEPLTDGFTEFAGPMPLDIAGVILKSEKRFKKQRISFQRQRITIDRKLLTEATLKIIDGIVQLELF